MVNLGSAKSVLIKYLMLIHQFQGNRPTDSRRTFFQHFTLFGYGGNLLLAKLRAYGLSEGAVKLIESYLSDRSQQVRLGRYTSTWEKLIKGVPQGSILGPLLFNVFLNDIFYFISKSLLYNYADAYIHKDFNILKGVLESESLNLISWFAENFMKANSDKVSGYLPWPENSRTHKIFPNWQYFYQM